MKIIDRTPFFSADGKISLLDKARATMKYGASWVQETQAQAGVMAVFERTLDKKFILMRNITLPGVEINIPFVLVGPTGVYVMLVTALRGMYRAKGDMWGTLSNDNFSPSSINLLTLTARMARAVQVYFQRQGRELPTVVDPILLCADPGLHVESIRPIIRVVQSDAIERFAVSITSGREIMDISTIQDIGDRILTPRTSPSPEASESLPQASAPFLPGGIETPPTPEEQLPFPEYTLPDSQPGFSSSQLPPASESVLTDLMEAPAEEAPAQPVLSTASSPVQLLETSTAEPVPQVRKSRGFSSRQWILLGIVAIFEVLLLVVLFYMVARTF